MARIRTIKPEAFEDARLAKVSHSARWLFAALWTYADDEGRALYNLKRIDAYVFPHESVDTHRIFGELSVSGFVHVYEANGEPYFHIPSFLKHQKIERPSKSKHPDPAEHCQCCISGNSPKAHRILTEDAVNDHRLEQGTGNREKEKEKEEEKDPPSAEASGSFLSEESSRPPEKPKRTQHTYTEAYEAFWKAYPGGGNKEAGFKAWVKAGIEKNPDLHQKVMQGLAVKVADEASCAAAIPPQFFPTWKHAQGWINKRGWEDKLEYKPEKDRSPQSQVLNLAAKRQKREAAKPWAGKPWAFFWDDDRVGTASERSHFDFLAGRTAHFGGTLNEAHAHKLYAEQGLEAAMDYVWEHAPERKQHGS